MKLSYCRFCGFGAPYDGVIRPRHCPDCGKAQSVLASQEPPRQLSRRPVHEEYYDEDYEKGESSDYDIEELTKAVQLRINGNDSVKFGNACGNSAGNIVDDGYKRKGISKTEFKKISKKMDSKDKIEIFED